MRFVLQKKFLVIKYWIIFLLHITTILKGKKLNFFLFINLLKLLPVMGLFQTDNYFREFVYPKRICLYTTKKLS